MEKVQKKKTVILCVIHHRQSPLESTGKTIVCSIITAYGLTYRGIGVRFLAGAENFAYSTVSRPALRSTQPPVQWVRGPLSTGINRPGLETDWSPPSSAKDVKACPTLHQAWYLMYVFYTPYPGADRLCGLVDRVPGYRSRGPGFDFRRYQIFWEVVGLEWGPLSLVRIIEELLEWKSSGFGHENRNNGRWIRCADHATPSIRKSWH
jgi:hypothetical protein